MPSKEYMPEDITGKLREAAREASESDTKISVQWPDSTGI